MRFTRKSMLVLVAAMAAGSAAPAGAAEADVCQVEYRATFAPALPGTGSTVQGGTSGSIRIDGTQTCVGTGAATATVSVGTATFTTEGANAESYTWQDPAGTIQGGCINNQTNAVSVVRWDDDAISLIQYTTNALTYGIMLTGTGIASVEAIAVDPIDGQPETHTITATRDVGATVAALLVAAADSPTAPNDAFSACSGGGLTQVTLTGVQVSASAP